MHTITATLSPETVCLTVSYFAPVTSSEKESYQYTMKPLVCNSPSKSQSSVTSATVVSARPKKALKVLEDVRIFVGRTRLQVFLLEFLEVTRISGALALRNISRYHLKTAASKTSTLHSLLPSTTVLKCITKDK